LPGDYGKPRPALVIQADAYQSHPSVTILPITGTLRDAPFIRVRLNPSAANGLRKESEVMVDKAMTLPRERLGECIGRLAAESLVEVERRLALFLGIAK
jgi:mRNA interferase MazF